MGWTEAGRRPEAEAAAGKYTTEPSPRGEEKDVVIKHKRRCRRKTPVCVRVKCLSVCVCAFVLTQVYCSHRGVSRLLPHP